MAEHTPQRRGANGGVVRLAMALARPWLLGLGLAWLIACGDGVDCTERYVCERHGACTFDADTRECRAGSNADCQQSNDCPEYGECTFDGKAFCIAGSDAECAQSNLCSEKNACTADDGKCVITGK